MQKVAGDLGEGLAETACGYGQGAEDVGALLRAGLEVPLDVVFNHTAEADQLGPTLCYRGLDNAAYYRLDPGDPRQYVDTTGCGNAPWSARPALC